jgi:hypothetical protein
MNTAAVIRFTIVCLLALVAAFQPAANARAQSLNPPPPPDAKCISDARGTVCNFTSSNEGTDAPNWNGVICDGFTINNTYHSHAHIKQTFSAAGEIIKEVRHTTFTGTLANSTNPSNSLPIRYSFYI